MHRFVVETDGVSHMVADDLDEVEHFDRAGELEANDLLTVNRHARQDRRRVNTISPAMSSRCAADPRTEYRKIAPCPPQRSARPVRFRAVCVSPETSPFRIAMPCL